MPSGTGLDTFGAKFPDRTFDVGIAEQHAVTFAAGLAADGMKPFAAIYSTFLQRGYDQVVHDVAIQHLPVRFAMDRAGLVGADGPTHAGSFDVGYLGQLPGFIVHGRRRRQRTLAHGRHRRADRRSPSALPLSARRRRRRDAARTPQRRSKSAKAASCAKARPSRCSISARACRKRSKAADKLAAMGLSTTLADARFAKPLDEDLIRRLAREHEVLLTIEEGAEGGFGAFVLHFLARDGLLDRGLKIRTLTLPDIFQDQDKPEAMYAAAGLDADAIANAALLALGRGGISEARA